MGEKVLMKGNEVIAEAAIRAGCRHFFGYPITPQNEIGHYLAARMPKVGGVFLQAESEVAAIHMVYGAASAGKRALTSSSSPGISLKQEGLSYLAGAELPAVVVNIMRCGPGLGGILSAQGDYFQTVKGGGHGDYKILALAPETLQELYECMVEAFDIADRYRTLVMVMGDGNLGQMMEAVEFREAERAEVHEKPWATVGTGMARPNNVITSIYIEPEVLEGLNERLQAKYRVMEERECRVEEYRCEGAEIIVTAYGTVSRIVKNVIDEAAKEGISVGLIRPITLWPFPSDSFARHSGKVGSFLTVELSAGQMVEDVRLAVGGACPVHFHGRTGGMIPTQRELLEKIRSLVR